MKNTHGKCFIISSCSPRALWHGSVSGRTSPSGRLSLALRAEAEWGGMGPMLCHFLSDHFGGICSYFLPATIPHLHPCLPSSALAACPVVQRCWLQNAGGLVGSGGRLETLGTPTQWTCIFRKLRNGSRTRAQWILTSKNDQGAPLLWKACAFGARVPKWVTLLIQTVIIPHAFSWLFTRKESQRADIPQISLNR